MLATIRALKVDHDYNPRLHDANNFNFNVDEMINLIIDNGWLRESIIIIGNFDEFKGKIIQGNKRVTALKIIDNPELIDELKRYHDHIIFSISNETLKKIENLTEYDKKLIFDKVHIEQVKTLDEQKSLLFELNEFNGHEKWSVHAKIKFLSEQASIYPNDLEIFNKLKLLINEHGEQLGYVYAISLIIKKFTTDMRISEELYKILTKKILNNKSILKVQDIKLQINDCGIEATSKNGDFNEIIMTVFYEFKNQSALRISDKETFILNSPDLSRLLEFEEEYLLALKNKNDLYNSTKKLVQCRIDNIIRIHTNINYDSFKNTEYETSIALVNDVVATLAELKYMYKTKIMYENLSSSINFQTKKTLDAYLTLLMYKHFKVSEIIEFRENGYLSLNNKYLICQKNDINVFIDKFNHQITPEIDNEFINDNLLLIISMLELFIVNNTFSNQTQIKM